jgi:ubiquitin-conjugating enzyme E2 A
MNCKASSLRLMSDLKAMKQTPPEGVSASPLTDENMYIWGCTIVGPEETAWEGGIFSLRITYGDQYPDKPPRVRFTSEMVRRGPAFLPRPSPLPRGLLHCFTTSPGPAGELRPSRASPAQFHPNIFPDGTLCLDLIQDNWSPIYTTSSILIALRSLLTDPNCASPANPEAAHMFQTDNKSYNRKVRRATRWHRAHIALLLTPEAQHSLAFHHPLHTLSAPQRRRYVETPRSRWGDESHASARHG